MKIRNGFVSNSSSSSFMVGLPKGMTDKEKRDFLLKKMFITEDSFFYRAAKEVADCIIDSTPMNTIEDLMNDYGYDTLEDFKEDYPRWANIFDKKELDLFAGSASNDSYDVGEQLFCDMEWFVNDDDFYIDKNSSF